MHPTRSFRRRGEGKIDHLLLFCAVFIGLVMLAWWRMPELQRAVRGLADRIEARFGPMT